MATNGQLKAGQKNELITGEPPILRRAVFLDRDGVVNAAVVHGGRPYPPPSLSEMSLLPGVEEACRTSRNGFVLILITNQPDIARGKATTGEVEPKNAVLRPASTLTKSASVRMTMRRSVSAANPLPACYWKPQRTLDPQSSIQFHRGRSMAGHRSRTARRMQRHLRRLRLRRTAAAGSFLRVRSLLEAANWIELNTQNGGLEP